jgi:hypothetical protein
VEFQRLQSRGLHAFTAASFTDSLYSLIVCVYSVLGPKSRFGDGDGSFWDKWVVASVPLSKGMDHSAGYDQSGMPIPRLIVDFLCLFITASAHGLARF